MGEAIGLAASIIAIIELTARIGSLCLEYSSAVRNAEHDAARLHSRVTHLSATLRGVHDIVQGPNVESLPLSQELHYCLQECNAELAKIQTRLDMPRAGSRVQRFGFRSLKWPFDSKEISAILLNLQSCEQTIMLGLQVDQTGLLCNIVQRMENTSISMGDETSIVRRPCFNVPFEPDPDYIDRPDIQVWLAEQHKNRITRMALIGMGGMGKSQVAIHHAHHIRGTNPQGHVFWVNASSKPKLEEGYQSIADNLQIPKRNNPSVNILRLVRDWLQRDETGPWFMILDNLDDVGLLFSTSSQSYGAAYPSPPRAAHRLTVPSEQLSLMSFIPRRREGIILVTSRSLDAAERITGSSKTIYKITAMEEDHALEMFRKKLDGEFDEGTARKLLHVLDYIPLAISQAAAYINRRIPRVSVKSYLEDILQSDKRKESLLHREGADLRRNDAVSNSIVATWQVTFEQILRERPSAACLMSFMSLFNPQNIPTFILHNFQAKGYKNGESDGEVKAEFEDDLDVLRGYSLISLTPSGEACGMHPLVQFCIRTWVPIFDNVNEWKQSFFLLIASQLPSLKSLNLSAFRVLFPHVEPVWEQDPQDSVAEAWIDMVILIGSYLLVLAKYQEAKAMFEKSLTKSTAFLGEHHETTLRCMDLLFSTYEPLNDWERAESMCLRLVKGETEVFGAEARRTLRSMTRLAQLYIKQSRLHEAEKILLHTMNLHTRPEAVMNTETVATMVELADVYQCQGRSKDATDWQEQACRALKMLAMEEDQAFHIVAKRSQLAGLYLMQGQNEQAEALANENSEVCTRFWGADHLTTLHAQDQLGRIYLSQSKYEEAQRLYLDLLERSSRAVGRDHPSTVMVIGGMAMTFLVQGQYSKAEPLFLEAVQGYKRGVGEEHPYTLSAMADLCGLYEQQGRHQEVEPGTAYC